MILGELAVTANVVAQITASQEVHHEVEVVSVLERVQHVDYEAAAV